MRYYETFEEEKWIFGRVEILELLDSKKVLSIDGLKRDAWALDGVRFAEEEVQPIVAFLFRYPMVK